MAVRKFTVGPARDDAMEEAKRTKLEKRILLVN